MINDEFDDGDLDLDDSSFDEFEEKSGTLGGFLKDNPIAKMGVIVGAIVVVFAVVIMMGGKEAPLDQSYVGQAPDISAPPGTQSASQEYIEAIQEVNERNVEEAEATGTSALPTPIEPPVGVLAVPEEDQDVEDPLQRWRRLQEERLQRELQQAQTIEPTALPDDTARQEQLQALADAMSTQMQAVLDSKENKISYIALADSDALEDNLQSEEAQTNSTTTEDDGELEEEVIGELLLAAGELSYAQLLIEANSDSPAPVLARVLSGPLKGGKLIGEFEVVKDGLVIRFDRLILNDDTIDIDAVALDPDTNLPSLATEVDNRYLSRVMLPAAAAFVTGLADAIAESGRTTVTITGETATESIAAADDEQEVATGIAELGEELGDIIDEEVRNIKPLVRVAAGTPIGVLFVEHVAYCGPDVLCGNTNSN